MPESVLQWIVFAGSFFLAGWAVGVAAESIRAFPHDQYLLGLAKRRAHAAQQWKTAAEFLSIALGGVVGSCSTAALGGWIVAAGLFLTVFFGGAAVHRAEWKLHTLEADMRRRAEERR